MKLNGSLRYLGICAFLLCARSTVAEPFDGIFRPNYEFAAHWNCKDIGRDGGAVAIQGNELLGVENICELSHPVKVNGMNAILYDSTCWGEGVSSSERIMLMKSDHGVYVITDGHVADWKYCN